MIIKSQHDYILDSVYDFFKDDHNFLILKEILDGEHHIPEYHPFSSLSLRLIDWFVTKYAKQYNISYHLPHSNRMDSRYFLFMEYKNNLRGYNKKNSDPFRRIKADSSKQIIISHPKYGDVKTSICQLNFFKWAIRDHVLVYLLDHFEQVNIDMNLHKRVRPEKYKVRLQQ